MQRSGGNQPTRKPDGLVVGWWLRAPVGALGVVSRVARRRGTQRRKAGRGDAA
jgi:hypothetical protein